MKIYISNYIDKCPSYTWTKRDLAFAILPKGLRNSANLDKLEALLGKTPCLEGALRFVYNFPYKIYNFIYNKLPRRIGSIKVGEQVSVVKVDKWDLYSLDVTLAKIIAATLLEFKECVGVPKPVEQEDVPDKYKNMEDKKTKLMAWRWVLDEMIYAFTFIADRYESDGLKEVNNDRVKNGLRLFGKYFRCLWY